MDYSKLKLGDEAPGVVYAVIEIPRGLSNKYEFDTRFETIKLDRVLYPPFDYPGEYGFMPETVSEDGDPADILVLVSQPTFPGCLLKAKPIGLLRMEDAGELDYKVLAVACDDHGYENINNYQDLPKFLLEQIETFFKNYKKLEDKITKILGWEDEKKAKEYIQNVHQKYLELKK
ncbi:MAG: inorganic diphosphatase [Candidatus Paceibacterota bacterium]|jgi:inorganic pyrophosphatase